MDFGLVFGRRTLDPPEIKQLFDGFGGAVL
jgi:hypothetical protein